MIDVASYLEVEAEAVNVLNEETDRLVFCFHHEEDYRRPLPSKAMNSC
ncbi:MAG: hypothetical protein ACLVJX_03480 [Merdibacter sp.]